MTEKTTRTRKAPAKKTAPRKRAAAPKPPVQEVPETTPEVTPVSEENNAPVENTEDKPKRGRRPNVVGQANSRFVKAKARLDKAEARAAKVQDVRDELEDARAEYEVAEREYREAFAASLGGSSES